MFAAFMPLLVSAGSVLFGWLERRRMISEEFARSFYSWVDSLGERQKIPSELRQRVLDQRARLDAKEAVQAGSPPVSNKEK